MSDARYLDRTEETSKFWILLEKNFAIADFEMDFDKERYTMCNFDVDSFYANVSATKTRDTSLDLALELNELVKKIFDENQKHKTWIMPGCDIVGH